MRADAGPADRRADAEPHVYACRKLGQDDLPLIKEWLREPHVAAWWGDPDEQYGLISADIDDPRVKMLLMLLDGRAVGYVQTWRPQDWPGHPFNDQPVGTFGMDPFIGEPGLVGQGHGTRLLRMLTDRLLAEGAPRVMIDPDPTNAVAIRAYAAAGFRSVEVRDTDDGPALLMIRDAIQPPPDP